MIIIKDLSTGTLGSLVSWWICKAVFYNICAVFSAHF